MSDKKKLILQNDSTLDWPAFLAIASRVILMGKISNNGDQYCYLSAFTIDGEDFHVVSDVNKRSDRITIYNVSPLKTLTPCTNPATK